MTDELHLRTYGSPAKERKLGEKQAASRDAALNRIKLAIKTVSLEHGKPHVESDSWVRLPGDQGTKDRYSAVWFIDGSNHGLGVDWYHADRIHIRAWGKGPDYNVDIWTKDLKYHRLIEAAVIVGLIL